MPLRLQLASDQTTPGSHPRERCIHGKLVAPSVQPLQADECRHSLEIRREHLAPPISPTFRVFYLVVHIHHCD